MTDVNSIEVPQVNSLPPAPLRSEAGNAFALKAEAFVAALPTFRVGMIALESVTRQLALITQANALAAAQSASQANDSKAAAAQSATLANDSKVAAAQSATLANDSKVAAAQSATDAANSKNAAAQSANSAAMSASSTPIIRITKNQALFGASGAPPVGWSAHPNCAFENVCVVGSDLTPESRHPIAKELLDYIGIRNVVYFGMEFYIWRMTWPAGTPYLMYQFVNLSSPLTICGAYTKLETGAVSGAWAEGITNTWKLTGHSVGGGMVHGYWVIHPLPSNAAPGSLLFALPAAIIGRANLVEPQNWALYPYIGDQQYD